MLKTLLKFTFIIGWFMSLNACSNKNDFVTWKEEVKLNDGRVIVVEQKKRMSHGVDREAWLTFTLPEFGGNPIVWHGHLTPMILNIESGKLYLVGWPPTSVERRFYGDPQPPYVGFVWQNSEWHRISFREIPERIYDANMLITSVPPEGTKLLSLEKKYNRELNGNPDRPTYFKHINPNAI